MIHYCCPWNWTDCISSISCNLLLPAYNECFMGLLVSMSHLKVLSPDHQHVTERVEHGGPSDPPKCFKHRCTLTVLLTCAEDISRSSMLWPLPIVGRPGHHFSRIAVIHAAKFKDKLSECFRKVVVSHLCKRDFYVGIIWHTQWP